MIRNPLQPMPAAADPYAVPQETAIDVATRRAIARTMIDKLPRPKSSDPDAQPLDPHGTPEELEDKPLSLAELESFLHDIKHQPNWRREADRCCDYYDGNQLSPDTVEKLKERGQPELITNLIKPNIDTCLGLEAKTRTDWIVRPEDDDIASSEVAEALSVKLKHAETESRADRACSDAYAAQLKAGIGWVEVARDTDPFNPNYRVGYVHRREIYWDWRSEKSDLTDARYLIRRRWLEIESAIALMPQYASLFRMTTTGWAGFDPVIEQDTQLVKSFFDERDTRLEATDWRDTQRQRVCLHEVWYRKWVKGYVMLLPNKRVVEFDLKNDNHCAAVLSGIVKVREAVFQRVRLAWYCGPHFLYDIPSPYKHRYFPYVPFFGYREDLTQAPYGLIRSMISPQDEVNARKSKQLWLLNSRRVIADSDAVVDHTATMAEVGRPDSYIILNQNRRPNSRFEIEVGADLAVQQGNAMIEAKTEINEASGIHKSMMGQTSSANSGVAISQLIEQGLNTLAEINDNYNFSRRLTGELLLSLLLEDLEGVQTAVRVGQGSSQRTIVLNQYVPDPNTGEMVLINDTTRVKARVVLDDIKSSPTYRMQVMTQLAEITKSLPPEAQAAMSDLWVEASDLPGKERVIDRLRMALNLPDDSPQGREKAAQQAAEAAQMQKMMAELAMREQAAKIKELEAKAAKLMADARAAGAPQDDGSNEKLAEMQKEFVAELVKMREEMEKLRDDVRMREMELRDKSAELKLRKEEVYVKARTDVAKAKIAAEATLKAAEEQAKVQKEVAKAKEKEGAEKDPQADKANEALLKQIEQLKDALDDLKRQQAEDKKVAAAKEQGKKEAEKEGKEAAKAEKDAEKAAKKDDDATAKKIDALMDAMAELTKTMAAPRETKILEDKDGRPIGTVSKVIK